MVNSFTEPTWVTPAFAVVVKELMQPYVKYPPRKLQSEGHRSPITLTDYERFQQYPRKAEDEGLQASDTSYLETKGLGGAALCAVKVPLRTIDGPQSCFGSATRSWPMVYFYFLNANGAARRSHDSSVPSFGQVLGTVTTHTAKFMLWFDLAATSSPYSCKGCTATLATKLVQSIAQPFVIGDHKLEIGVSIGITMYPDDCKIGEELTRKADQAMYAAKQIGGGSYRFYRNTLS